MYCMPIYTSGPTTLFAHRVFIESTVKTFKSLVKVRWSTLSCELFYTSFSEYCVLACHSGHLMDSRNFSGICWTCVIHKFHLFYTALHGWWVHLRLLTFYLCECFDCRQTFKESFGRNEFVMIILGRNWMSNFVLTCIMFGL